MFIRENAESFLHAFYVLKENNDVFVEKQSGQSKDPLALKSFGSRPAMGVGIVCLAFSLELYLKSLHYMISKDKITGHNIKEIFGKFPKEIQQKIFEHPAVSKYGWNLKEFEKQLGLVSDGFQKWRYSHEFTTIKYESYFALVLIEAVDSVLNQLQMSLNEKVIAERINRKRQST